MEEQFLPGDAFLVLTAGVVVSSVLGSLLPLDGQPRPNCSLVPYTFYATRAFQAGTHLVVNIRLLLSRDQ